MNKTLMERDELMGVIAEIGDELDHLRRIQAAAMRVCAAEVAFNEAIDGDDEHAMEAASCECDQAMNALRGLLEGEQCGGSPSAC